MNVHILSDFAARHRAQQTAQQNRPGNHGIILLCTRLAHDNKSSIFSSVMVQHTETTIIEFIAEV